MPKRGYRRRTSIALVSTAAGACVGALAQLFRASNNEAVVACVIAVGAVHTFFAFRPVKTDVEKQKQLEQNYQSVRTRKSIIRTLVAAGVLLGLVLLRSPIQKVSDSIFQRRVQTLSSDPNNATSAQETKRILDSARAAQLTFNPAVVANVTKPLVRASDDPVVWPAALSLVDYRSFLNSSLPSPTANLQELPSHTRYNMTRSNTTMLIHYGRVPIGQAAQLDFIGVNHNAGRSDGDAFLVVLGGRALLDHMQIRNVVFQNMTLVYDGGPAIMENVYFVNCTFEMALNPNSQALVTRLTESSPLTYSLPRPTQD